MSATVVWVSIRNPRSRSCVYHDIARCMDRGGVRHTIPTSREYVEGLGFARCSVCIRREQGVMRRQLIVALREQGLTFQQISIRIAARFDVGKSLVHKDYQRAIRERAS